MLCQQLILNHCTRHQAGSQQCFLVLEKQDSQVVPFRLEDKSPASGTHVSLPRDLGQGARHSVLQFPLLKSGVSRALIDSTTRDTGTAVGHRQETFLPHCQIDKKQATAGPGPFVAGSLRQRKKGEEETVWFFDNLDKGNSQQVSMLEMDEPASPHPFYFESQPRSGCPLSWDRKRQVASCGFLGSC